MKFHQDKKQSIVLYILEKIESDSKSVAKVTADAFEISLNTVHQYLNELIENKIIEKTGRGQYALLKKHFSHHFKRSNGDLKSDTYAFDVCLKEHISHLADNVRHIWSYAFSEMVNNVMDHSEAENMRVIISQSYLKTSAIIIDDGVGIFEKIKEHFSLSSLDEAICELFKGKLTTDAQNHSGEGIFFTSKMMDSFLIVSGEKMFGTSKYEIEGVVETGGKGKGTCVGMSLSNFTNKTAAEIFDLYSNVDGGFTKTYIPLKNIFDSAPVSRSQAKRVANRLELFGEIVLDFNGIDWMGQGFAHQLFVIFKNAHPEIKLIPENMNESVKNMYNHVTASV